jgi:hypothetical protein
MPGPRCGSVGGSAVGPGQGTQLEEGQKGEGGGGEGGGGAAAQEGATGDWRAPRCAPLARPRCVCGDEEARLCVLLARRAVHDRDVAHARQDDVLRDLGVAAVRRVGRRPWPQQRQVLGGLGGKARGALLTSAATPLKPTIRTLAWLSLRAGAVRG